MSRIREFDMQFTKLQNLHVWYMTQSNHKGSFLKDIRDTNLENWRKLFTLTMRSNQSLNYPNWDVNLLQVQQMTKATRWFWIIESLHSRWSIASSLCLNDSWNPWAVMNQEKLEVCEKICEDLQGSPPLLSKDWWACPCGLRCPNFSSF